MSGVHRSAKKAVCIVCDAVFICYSSKAMFCSDRCKEKAAAEQRIRQEMSAAYEEQIAEMRQAVAAAEAKAGAGQNELVQKFAFHFEAVQREFTAMMDLIGSAEDSDTANRLTGAALKLVRQMEKRFGGEGG